MRARTPQTIKKIPTTHCIKLGQNRTKTPAIIASIAIAVLLMEKLFFAIVIDSFLPWNVSIVLVFIINVNNP